MKWEYKVLKFNMVDFLKSEAKLADELDKLGNEEWELVAPFTSTAGGIPYMAFLVFKRPKPSQLLVSR